MCPQLQTLRCPDPPKWASLHFHSKPKSWQRTGADAGTRSSPSEPCPPAGEATPQGKGHQVRSTCDRGGRWAGPRPVGATQRPDRGNGGGGMGRVPQVWMELRANQGQEAGQWEVELGFEGTVSLALEEMVRKPKRVKFSQLPKTSHLGSHFSRSGGEGKMGAKQRPAQPCPELSLWPPRPLQPGPLECVL